MDFLGNVAAANYNNSITPAEKQLRPILCDENIKVLSTFELNQVASLTYNDVTCDGIFEFIQQICSKPLDYTPLTLQKTLIVTKHIMVYGSEKTVSHAYSLQGCLQPLLEFNTVLMTQQQGGAMSFFQSLQGGAVDKGGPVREASREILMLLGNVHELRRLRVSSASEDSLVPVGDNGQAGFISDEVKLDVLKRRMAEEQRVRIQSNLKKSQGGFGGGYASKDGRSVVGAAHGIEEMIKMANKCGSKTSKFSDDGVPYQKTQEELILEELKMEADAEKAKRKATPTVDLLGGSSFAAPPQTFAAPSADIDLLDFGGGSSSTGVLAMGDLLGGGAASADPFGLASAYNTTNASAATATRNTTIYSAAPTPSLASSSLLDFSVQNDPFAPMSAAPNPNPSVNNDSTGLMSMTMNQSSSNNNNPMMSMMQPPMQHDLASEMGSMYLSGTGAATSNIMASNEDRYSALDALAAAAPTMAQVAKDTEARLLGFGPSSSSNISASAHPSMPMGMSMSMGMAPPPSIPEPMVAPGSGHVATTYGAPSANSNNNDDGDDNPWMMGGTSGMGLQPIGPVPTAPPPPPPPGY